MQLKKLILTNILIIVIALLILWLLVFTTINSTLKDQFIFSNQLVLRNGVDLIENFIKEGKDLVLDIAVDPDIQDGLDRFQAEQNTGERIEKILEQNTGYLGKMRDFAGSVEFFPYKDSSLFEFDEERGAYVLIEAADWMNEVIAADGSFIIEKTDFGGNSYIRVAMLVRSINHWPRKRAVMVFYIRLETLLSLFYQIRLENSNQPYLVNESGEIILPYENVYRISDSDLLSRQEGWFIRNDRIIINEAFLMTDWKLMGIFPENKLMEKSRDIRRTFFIVGGLVVSLLILVSVLFSVWITKPITELAEAMSKVEKDDFKEIDLEFSRSYGRETRQLYSQYNYMIRRINSLIEEMYLAQIREKEAELLALQQQINPHFLYNTLDSIAWMSLAYKAEDIRHMVLSLASMMRYSLNEGNNFILVRDELEQVRNYVGIQEIRYDNKFSTMIKCDPQALDYKIIKLIIQPLVENAIVHGFKDTGRFGKIDINVVVQEKNLVIEVINDGVEIDLKKIRDIFNPDSEYRPRHYGLKNVNDRLVKRFGKQSAIVFSIDQERTSARIVIPLVKIDNSGGEVGIRG